MKKVILFLSISVCCTAQLLADFGVVLRSTLSDETSAAAPRLFGSGAPSGPGVNPLPKDTPVWLVIDVDGGGVFNPGALEGISYDGTVEDLLATLIQPGDYVGQTTIPGPIPGRITRSFSLPPECQEGGLPGNQRGGQVKPAVAIVFDDPDLSNGGSFGFDETVASGPIPDVGSVDLRIGQDVYGDAYTFTVGGGGVIPPPPTLTNTTWRVEGDGFVVIQFGVGTVVGGAYSVQSTTNLNDQPIQWITETAFAGDGSLISVSFTNATPPDYRFYRATAAASPTGTQGSALVKE